MTCTFANTFFLYFLLQNLICSYVPEIADERFMKNYRAIVGCEAFRVRAPFCWTILAFKTPFLPLRALLGFELVLRCIGLWFSFLLLFPGFFTL